MMRPKSYPLLERCLEDGAACGWRRAHKHIDNPSAAQIQENIVEYQMNNICEAFDFDDPCRCKCGDDE